MTPHLTLLPHLSGNRFRPVTYNCAQMERLAELFEAIDADEPGDALHYARLFADTDDDLNQGATAEALRSQHLRERLEFLQARHNAAGWVEHTKRPCMHSVGRSHTCTLWGAHMHIGEKCKTA